MAGEQDYTTDYLSGERWIKFGFFFIAHECLLPPQRGGERSFCGYGRLAGI
jgi:hypothetical protein